MLELSGDSGEQKEAESWLVDNLSRRLGVKLDKKKFPLDRGMWIELDGFCESPLVLCEAWAHIGPPKSAQKNKVMADAFKLVFANSLFEETAKRILLFADLEAAAHFTGKSWMAECLHKYDIIVETMELPLDLKNKVLKAQKRQYR